jgi:hypothetical protein
VTETNLTIRCDLDLKLAFIAACKGVDVNASQVLRAAMRDFLASNSQPSLPLASKPSRKGSSK